VATQYYTATTLDGFIATVDHSLDWLVTRETDPDGPLGYRRFVEDVGAMAMGANTYQWMIDHVLSGHPAGWEWPYHVPCWVITHRDPPLPPGGLVRLTAGDVTAVHAEMTDAAGGRNLWIVGGGDLAGQFADAGLLDEVIVSIAPVTLGAGAPLLPRHLELRLEQLVQNGEFAAVRYRVLREQA
jgi:dihydrofolate reductase